MKKAITWISIITFIILLIDLVIFFTCIILKFFTNKCPYCGKIQIVNGKYCPHCGKELK